MDKELNFALEVVRKASIFTKQLQREKTALFQQKEDRSPVTIADYGAQILVHHHLQQVFPGDHLVAEENLGELSQSDDRGIDLLAPLLAPLIEDYSFDRLMAQLTAVNRQADRKRYWVLDPIDGTKGFLRGEQFAIALALIDDGMPVLGVLGCPNLNRLALPDPNGTGILAYACQGQGAWIASNKNIDQPVRLAVSECSDPSKARFVTSLDSTGHSNQAAIEAMKTHLGNREPDQQFDSQAKYVMVAAGQSDVFLRLPPKENPDYREKIWDHAAGAVIIQEAGGQVSDIYGNAFDFSAGRSLANNHGVLVTNGVLHQAVLAYFQQVGRERSVL
ncbi:MAG TPA: 3'(2'),5'-bisphosphate nucleotidase [Anaerolineaceae bacterium]|nr:3'(2'),5'-bisphosphate nucleotidase [Anaerolineaceae bacterium]